ncbi:MAG TPA: hypothetical protein VNS10_11685, partial [Gemmatimonadaceae bacterium]|nr:hypothetical protein [Gemmatimonadaceae bacterium]
MTLKSTVLMTLRSTVRRLAWVGGAMTLAASLSCMDLTVTNNNNPDRVRATNTPGDVEGLIAGTFQRFWPNVYGTTPTIMLSEMAYEFSTPFLCFGGQPNGLEPRPAWNNNSSYTYAGVSSTTWLNLYGVISLANDGLQALDRGIKIGPDGANNSRARAFAKFMQGVAHGYLGLLWDRAVIIDEKTDVDTLVVPHYARYDTVITAAIGMLKQSIAISDTAKFSLPNAGWIPGLTVTNTDLSRLAHTYIARFEAYMARTPAERAAVNWTDVIANVDAGITTDFAPIGSPTTLSDSYKQIAARVRTVPGDYMRGSGWLVGPADSTDAWKNWVATPVANRVAFQLRTQDRRIVGADGVSTGSYFNYNTTISFYNPTRGTYLQSYYYYIRYGAGTSYQNGPLAAIGRTEMDMLKAEGLIRLNRASEAVPLINKTRVANGKLPALDVSGPPNVAGCVPRKTTGACGSLWDALRYEKRIEGAGVDGQVAYLDARGWNTLTENSFVMFPIPGRELEIQQLPIYTYGGGGSGSAPKAT